MDFGKNIALLSAASGYYTIVEQILYALKASVAKYIFFCEHDVLYHPSHFDFLPSRDDIYYYNTNNWRWDYPHNRLIRYRRLISLSMMCCNRELAIDHYERRKQGIIDHAWYKYTSREPRWQRLWGYEPGTKKKKRGGFSDEDFDTFHSKHPNIDIRHSQTFSMRKIRLEEFTHKPKDWQETTLERLDGWDLKDGLKHYNTG